MTKDIARDKIILLCEVRSMSIIDKIKLHNNNLLINDTIEIINNIKSNSTIINEIIDDNFYSISSEDIDLEIKCNINNKIKFTNCLSKQEIISFYNENPLYIFNIFEINCKSTNNNLIFEETIIVGKPIYYMTACNREIKRKNNSENIIISKKEVMNFDTQLIVSNNNYYNFDNKESKDEKTSVYKNIYLNNDYSTMNKRENKLYTLLKCSEKELDKKLLIKNLRRH